MPYPNYTERTKMAASNYPPSEKFLTVVEGSCNDETWWQRWWLTITIPAIMTSIVAGVYYFVKWLVTLS